MNKAYWKNKKVLVTGAEGFVGSHFLNELQKNKVNVIGSILKIKKNSKAKGKLVQLDILNKKKLNYVCKSEKINLIIHCAALDGNPEFKKNNSERIVDENIKMALNILNVAKENKIKEIVILSSTEIYSSKAKSPIKESDDYLKNFPTVTNGYVASKIAIEILSELYINQFGLKILQPRPTNIYGSGDAKGGEAGRVIPSLIKSILEDKKVEIWGDGSQIRDFIYIKDFTKSIISLLEKGEYITLNVASGEVISIKNLVQLIANISGHKAKLSFKKDRPVGVKKRILDISKLKSLIDFNPIPLTEGLKKMIEEGINK